MDRAFGIIGLCKDIVFVGVVVLLVLDIFGKIDIESECPICARMIEQILPSAFAADRPMVVADDKWARIRIVVH